MIDLAEIARTLVAPGKGILAADESVHTADARLTSYGITPSEEMRRKFRDLFLAAPGAEHYLSGVILFSETIGQKANEGTLFGDMLTSHGIAPGVKVDEGIEPLVDDSKEVITKGLIGLPERLADFRGKGMQFTKWRSVLRIEGDRHPTAHAIVENAKRLALYARAVQEAGMVPILEPEVLFEGKHNRLRTKSVITQGLKTVFAALADQAVDMSGIIVKTAMALSGKESGKKDTPEEVAKDTIEALVASVPAQVPGIVFLSGGQTPDQATENLEAISQQAKIAGAPWPLTFSYARALQDEALTVWQGKDENVTAAREAFLTRLKKVSAALG
ncbi:MAG: class I fructose-bisphosphate aldolase [Minisyncoccia bacterium]